MQDKKQQCVLWCHVHRGVCSVRGWYRGSLHCTNTEHVSRRQPESWTSAASHCMNLPVVSWHSLLKFRCLLIWSNGTKLAGCKNECWRCAVHKQLRSLIYKSEHTVNWELKLQTIWCISVLKCHQETRFLSRCVTYILPTMFNRRKLEILFYLVAGERWTYRLWTVLSWALTKRIWRDSVWHSVATHVVFGLLPTLSHCRMDVRASFSG